MEVESLVCRPADAWVSNHASLDAFFTGSVFVIAWVMVAMCFWYFGEKALYYRWIKRVIEPELEKAVRKALAK